ncbi:MAG: M48 family metallopeptidase [Cellvibrionaceae bacterium]|nr:M48 family metallopeptidase [Cellvibrionaceae bacterium]
MLTGSFSCGAFPGMLAASSISLISQPVLPVSTMPKKFRVISQAEAVAGKTKQDVHKALLKTNMKPEQIQLLLLKPLVIKKGLDQATAQEYAERFSAAGLKVRIEAYEVAEPADASGEDKQRKQIFSLLLKTFANPIQPAALVEKNSVRLPGAIISALPAPVAYSGLVVAVALGLLWYLGAGQALIFGGLEFPPAVMTFIWVISWLLPAFVGSVLLIFLLYPMWPRRRPEPYLRLDPKRHAHFHRVINQMTAAMDVAAPELIEISAAADIRVAPARGLRSLKRGDLRLTLGLALVAGCSVQQLAGLLAREFGRYASPSATRAAIWIHTINQWFARRSRTPDEWDQRFDHWAVDYPGNITHGAIALARSLTHRVRRLLARLAGWNTKTTYKTLRRLERDADLFQMRVAGSEGFRALALQLHQLIEAERDIHHLNHLALYHRELLLRDLPAAIAEAAAHPTPELLAAAENSLAQTNPRLWEARAADSLRLAQAAEVRDPGMVTCDLPAHLLLEDFPQLCDSATLNAYHRQGTSDAAQHRVDNARILTERTALQAQSRIDNIQKGGRAPVNADGSIEWTAGQP